MRAATKKRAAQNRLYSKLRREFLASNPRCQFPDCGNASAELHHKKGRVGRLLTDPDHFAALCSGCHRYVTEHPAEAIALGISESRLTA
jgi:hypothetical protein